MLDISKSGCFPFNQGRFSNVFALDYKFSVKKSIAKIIFGFVFQDMGPLSSLGRESNV